LKFQKKNKTKLKMAEQPKKKQKSETDTDEFSDVFSKVIFVSFHFRPDGRASLTKYYKTNGSAYEMQGQKIQFDSTGWGGQGQIDVPEESIVTIVDSKGVHTDINFEHGIGSLITDFCNLVKLDQKTTGELASYIKAKMQNPPRTDGLDGLFDLFTDDLPSKLKCKMSETAKQKLLKLVSYKFKLKSIHSEYREKSQEAQIKYKKQAALERLTNLYKQHQEYLDSIIVKADFELLGLKNVSVHNELSLFENYFKSENKN
jgi:trehalose/maltose hydrolase-like predicted phosphorylase